MAALAGAPRFTTPSATSPFHDTFGYYAQGVEEGTAILPEGWKDRLVAIHNANTRGITGWCLEPHDLVISKYVANREKDCPFGTDAFRFGLARLEELERRLERLPWSPNERERSCCACVPTNARRNP